VRRALVWVVAGCSFAPSGHARPGDGATGSDGGLPGEAMIDALDVSRDCMPLWQNGTIAFYAPERISELSTPALERDPFISQDELTIYFSRPGSADLDVFTATRAHVGDPFGSASVFAPASSAMDDTKMSISLDQLTLVVCQYNGTGNFDAIATRASPSDPWPPLSATQLSAVDNTGTFSSAFDPELGSDGTSFIYAPVASNGQHLARAFRASTSQSFSVGSVPGYVLDSTYNDADPWFDPAGRLLVFSRSIAGGNGDSDIYYALGSAGGYGTPTLVPDVNVMGSGSFADGDAWVSPNGCRVYFSSNRDGNYDLYVANAR